MVERLLEFHASPCQRRAAGQTPVLHLVLQPRPQHHVRWTEDTVDNEHMNKKKSKKCCIYKKRRDFGESSSSSGSDDCGAKPAGWKRKPRSRLRLRLGGGAPGGSPPPSTHRHLVSRLLGATHAESDSTGPSQPCVAEAPAKTLPSEDVPLRSARRSRLWRLRRRRLQRRWRSARLARGAPLRKAGPHEEAPKSQGLANRLSGTRTPQCLGRSTPCCLPAWRAAGFGIAPGADALRP